MKAKKVSMAPVWGIVPFALADVGLSAALIMQLASSGGSTAKGVILGLLFGIGLFCLQVGFFKHGLKINAYENQEARRNGLAVVFLVMAIVAFCSAMANSIITGEDAGKQAKIEQFVQELRDWRDTHNEAMGRVNDAVLGLDTVAKHSEAWATLEKGSGGVSETAPGIGETFTQLMALWNATIKAQEAVGDFSQYYKPVRKKANVMLADMEYNAKRDNIDFDQKVSLVKENVVDLNGLANQFKNLWPISTFEHLAEVFTVDVKQYEAMGIPPMAARKIADYYENKGNHYYSLAIDLERSKDDPLPEWRAQSQFGYLFASPDLTIVLILSFLLAYATPLVLLVLVLSGNDKPVEREEPDNSGGNKPNREDFHSDQVQRKPHLVARGFDDLDFTRH